MTSIINHPQPPPGAQQECTCQVLPPHHVRPGDGTGVQDPWLTKLCPGGQVRVQFCDGTRFSIGDERTVVRISKRRGCTTLKVRQQSWPPPRTGRDGREFNPSVDASHVTNVHRELGPPSRLTDHLIWSTFYEHCPMRFTH